MLKSTKEYFQALRDGKYFLFLEWTSFVLDKYSKGKLNRDADDTINLLIYECLNSGFCLDDIKQYAVLYAVYELEHTPIVSELLYSMTSIYGAITHSMVYVEHHLQQHFLSSIELSAVEINRLMKKNQDLILEDTYQQYYAQEITRFHKLVEEVKPYDWKRAEQDIRAITDVRDIINQYLHAHRTIDLPNDQLKATRYSLLARLAMYFQNQCELNEEVRAQISGYVQSIRELQPADFEEAFLDKLSPPSFLETTTRVITSLGLRFFEMVKPQLLQVFIEKESKEENTRSSDSKAPTNS